MSKQVSPVTIIGAGPAGLSAAIQLADFDVKSTLIDENPKIGGAIFKQPDKGFENSRFKDEKTFQKARALFDQFEKKRHHITVHANSEVLGDFPSANELVILQNDEVKSHPNNPLILCTGCYERAQPFPGWTLPGIMSVGGLQLQAKCGNVVPGRIAVLAGTGPLLLVAAKQLHMAGVRVVAVVEAGLKRDLIGSVSKLFSNTKLLKEGADYMAYLKKNNIPMYYGHGIVSASGQGKVEEVKIAPLDKNWSPKLDKAISLPVEVVGVQYGYVPRIQLTQMLKCKHRFDETSQSFYADLDSWQRTSVEGIYAAGDNSGVYGADVAMLEGRIAALAYLLDIKRIALEEANKIAKPIFKEIERYKTFQNAFQKYSKLRPGLMDLPDQDTVVCRCEHVKMQEIEQAVESGANDITALKMRTRVGMGDCQGKMCGTFCSEYLSHKTGQSREEVGVFNPRFPMAPISFESIS